MALVPAAALERFIHQVLTAWGMPEAAARDSTAVMMAADLRGIDSHGISMLDIYERWKQVGKFRVGALPRVVLDRPVLAVIDGGGGLGHHPSRLATEMAIAKARAMGLAAVSVRNSHHYGAAGVYAWQMAEAGLIGISCSGVHNAATVPTFARVPMFGTNPWAFAAPAGRNPPFVLDMATSTVAIGKLKIASFAGKPVPEGWALDAEGRPVTDSAAAYAQPRVTPLGGSREQGSHKGYGLAAMVEILSTQLSGATYTPLRPKEQAPDDVGHFFLAIDPAAFRPEGGFEADMDALIDALHGCPPADPARPVLVHGDPERAAEAERRRDGIPVPAALRASLTEVARRAGVPVPWSA